MSDMLTCQKCACFFKLCSYCLISFISIKTCKLSGFFSLFTLSVNTYKNSDIVIILAHFKVLDTVAWSGMNAAGTAFQCYMISHDNRRKSVIKRVLCFYMFKFSACKGTNCCIIFYSGSFHCNPYKLSRHHIIFVTVFNKSIFILRSKTNCKVAWNCPCSSSPDHKINLA